MAAGWHEPRANSLIPSSTIATDLKAVAPRGIGWQALAPAIAFTSFALIVVSMRWYTRAVLMRTVGKDDILITLSMVLSIAVLAVVALQFHVDANLGHSRTPSVTTKLLLTEQCIYIAMTNTTKASLITTYLRVFHDHDFTRLRYACFVVFILLVGSSCYGVLAGIFLCSPVKKLWLPETPGHCWDSRLYTTIASILNIVFDFVVWLLPLPVLSRLNLPRRQMLSLLLVFMLGGFTCIVSIIRLVIVLETAHKKEFSKSGIAGITWSTIEGNTGIICASLITVVPLLNKVFPRLLASQEVSSRHMHLPIISEHANQPSILSKCTALEYERKEEQRGNDTLELEDLSSPRLSADMADRW